jgi:trehalose 6-phosphate phosphatase
LAHAAAPTLTTAHALFLDFDGTLTELAPRPEAVRVASG